MRKMVDRQYAEYNTHGESPLMSRPFFHQLVECIDDNEKVWHDSQWYYENMCSNILRSDYLNPFTMKPFGTVEELAEVAETCYTGARARRGTLQDHRQL